MEGSTNISLAPEVVAQLSQEFTKLIKESGLLLVEKNVAKFSYKFYEKRKAALSKKWVTTHEIVKWELIPGIKSVTTIKNMVERNEIPNTELFYEQRKSTEVLKISTKFIKRYTKAL